MAFWANAPNHPVRSYIVDIDETGRYTSAACRHRGHSLRGTPCRDSGPSKGIDSLLTAVIAVDSVKGVISRMLYEKETTGDKFASLVQHLLLPAIEGTGTRVITMDNLDGHSPAVKFVKAAGHYVVIHPIHSPDFGGVQWVFNFWIASFKPINQICATPICVRPWRQDLTVLHHKMWQDQWPKPTCVLRVTLSNLTWAHNKIWMCMCYKHMVN